VRDQIRQSRWYKGLLITLGWTFVGLGVLGIFLPLMPTTIFLILAAWCFWRSSPKFYQWLIEHPKLGHYVLHYLRGDGIPKRAKYLAIGMITVTMGSSVWLISPPIWVVVLLAAIGVSVSTYILMQPTFEADRDHDEAPSEPTPQHDDSSRG